MDKWIYSFNEGRAGDKALLGGKGANLAEMTHLGLPVPEGFTITTQSCLRYLETPSFFESILWEMNLHFYWSLFVAVQKFLCLV